MMLLFVSSDRKGFLRFDRDRPWLRFHGVLVLIGQCGQALERQRIQERPLHDFAGSMLPITLPEVDSMTGTIFIIRSRTGRTVSAREGVPFPHFEIRAARRALGFAALAESASEPKPVHNY